MDREDITLMESEGALVLRENSIPEIYIPIDSGEYCDKVRFTLAFLLYAIEREDWVEEFSTFVDSVKEQFHELDADERRSNFEVIDGDKE